MKKTLIGIILVILVVIVILTFNTTKNNRLAVIREKLDEAYDSSYSIIDSYYMWDTGGSKNIESIIKINDIYSLFMYDMLTGDCSDTYNGIKKGNDNLVSLLDIKNISVLYTDETRYYGAWGNAEIRVIIEKKDYNTDELVMELEKLINEFGNKYEKVNLNLYITDNIKESKTDEYKLFLTSQLGYRVDEEFYNKYNKNLVYKDFCVNFATNKYNETHYWTLETIKNELGNHKI